VSSAVLDASALIALLNQEPGADQLTPDILINAVSSTVNVAEVHGKLVERGLPPDKAWQASINSISEAVPFTAEHAKIAGGLMAQTRQFGLSLGDRACLALALQMKAPVYTADRSWKNLKLNLRIHVIR
jgi:PIN domain nuclease of toxin-antitoxin system